MTRRGGLRSGEAMGVLFPAAVRCCRNISIFKPKEDSSLKLRIASITILLFALVALPAMAQNDLYDNGPTNGTDLGWTINFGFAVSDQFTLASNSTVGGITLRLAVPWRCPRDG